MMTVKVHTVDTDVVVILVGALYDLSQTQPQADIWAQARIIGFTALMQFVLS